MARANIGCGYDKRDGYVNVDLVADHSPDVVGDALHLPFASGSLEEIIAVDVLEHIQRTRTQQCLTEWARVLAPGARLNLRVPNVVGAAGLLTTSQSLDHHRTLIQNLHGTQAYPGDYHLTTFTDLSLAADLMECGFGPIDIEQRDGWLFEVRADRIPNDSVSLALHWGEGFFAREGEEASWWRWSGPEARIVLVNPTTLTVQANVWLLLEAPHDPAASVAVEWPGGRSSVECSSASEIAFDVIAPPGRTPILLRGHSKAVDAPGDHRDLRFRALATPQFPTISVVGPQQTVIVERSSP